MYGRIAGRALSAGSWRMPPPKTGLAPAELHFVLQRAFEKVKPLECRACRIPAPQPAAPAEAGGANWTLLLPVPCEFDCARFMRWLWVQYRGLYDLRE